MSKYLLAIDGGGTKTDAVIADENGAIVGRGLSGPTSIATTSVGAASFNLIEAVRQTVENLQSEEQIEFPVIVMGLAGLDSPKEHDEAYKVFLESLRNYNIGKFILLNDSLIALENGSENQNAVILISGTGSNCFGRNENGEIAKTSGMDFLLTDQGSGYAIGRRVLREAVKSYDGRSPKSMLEKLVTDHFKIASISELKSVVYNPLLSKVEIAGLSHLCSQAYNEGDQVAKDIFERIVNEIMIMVSTVVSRLGMQEKSFDCVFSGAITKLPFIQEKLAQILKAKYTGCNTIFPNEDPVLGALKIAVKNYSTNI